MEKNRKEEQLNKKATKEQIIAALLAVAAFLGMCIGERFYIINKANQQKEDLPNHPDLLLAPGTMDSQNLIELKKQRDELIKYRQNLASVEKTDYYPNPTITIVHTENEECFQKKMK